MMASLASSSRELTPCSGMRDGVGSEGWLLFDVTEKLGMAREQLWTRKVNV